MIYKICDYMIFKECTFGYDIVNNQLLVNPIEAEIVKYSFEKYLEYELTDNTLKRIEEEIAEKWSDYLFKKTKEFKEMKDKIPITTAHSIFNIEKTSQPIVDSDIFEKVKTKSRNKKDEEL